MHGGLPPASLFPLSSLSMACLDPLAADMDSPGTSDNGSKATADSNSAESTAPLPSTNLLIDDPTAMTNMQQYNLDFYGHAKLRAWLRSLIYRMQSPARDDLQVLLTAGCSIALDSIFRMLLDDGDAILVEESMFPAVRCPCQAQHTCGSSLASKLSSGANARSNTSA